MKPFDSGLKWLDLLIHREIVRLRARYRLSLDEFRGLYVSDEQVDALVRESSAASLDLSELELHARRARESFADECNERSPFTALCAAFDLNECERQVLLIALAPELDAKYETLYAYLNNDVTKKAPTMSLIGRLLQLEELPSTQVRASLLPDASLLRQGLIRYVPGSDRHATLNAAIAVHRSLPAFVLGLGLRVEHGLLSFVRREDARARHIAAESDLMSRIVHSARSWQARREDAAPVWWFHGRDSERRADAVGALANALELDLLNIDCAGAIHAPEEATSAFRDALLWQRLSGAVLHLQSFDRARDSDGRVRPELLGAMRSLLESRLPICVDTESPAAVEEALRAASVTQIAIPDMAREARMASWRRALDQHGLGAQPASLVTVADSFALTVQQIDRAARILADDPARETATLHTSQLTAAARGCCDESLARLAQKLQLPFEWKDLILPPSVVRRLQDIVQAVRNRHVVFGNWGFARLAGGFGLRVLFAGPSGTGKTMAAATVARELGIDIFRVDISQTVSKYIGETEKNLDRIFAAAANSNAILFFDEADALFGKRSEVKDAHDRYSNIETAYLLQKIEEYQGIVFLASNLSRNMDSAFARRLNFVLDFPLPEKADRERLWRSMLDGAMPLSADVEFDFLASQFTLSGGDIRNVVLDAAFHVARDGERNLTMKKLIVALGRQLTKQGRAPSATEFKQHHAVLVQLTGEEQPQ